MSLSSLFSVRWHFIILFTHQKPCMSDEMSYVNPSENGAPETAHPASSPLNGLTVLDLAGSVSPHPSCRLHCHTVNTTANWTKPARKEAHAGIKQEARRSYLPLKKTLCAFHIDITMAARGPCFPSASRESVHTMAWIPGSDYRLLIEFTQSGSLEAHNYISLKAAAINSVCDLIHSRLHV